MTQEQKTRINDLKLQLIESLMENQEYSRTQAHLTVDELLKNYEEDIKWGEIGMLERDMKIYIKYGL